MNKRLLVFFGFFALYLATAFPSLAPYRDSGEMATSAWTLGVSHPTGYPLYILLGRLADSVPLGNPAYRLMILSALAAALAVAMIYTLSERTFGTATVEAGGRAVPDALVKDASASGAAGLGAALLLGLNSDFWAVAQVQEMYSLSVLISLILIALALRLGESYRERLWLGFVFLFGLFLGNRLEVLVLAPGLLWLALGGGTDGNEIAVWSIFSFLIFPAVMAFSMKNFSVAVLVAATALWLYPAKKRVRWALWSLVFAALGLSIYAYMPLRSGAGPWLDWHHTAVFSNLIESVLRTKYGGTLDLISENYRTGQLFGANMALYARHLWKEFSLVGLALCAAGFFKNWRDNRGRWLGLLSCWWWSGPFFLFLANMPPNPHAAAIVEPHYLLSDVILVLWAAEGLAWAARKSRPLSASVGAAFLAALAVVPFAGGRLHAMNRREHFFSLDYARNVFLCVPPNGTVVVKKDVQLYTLWYYQTVQGLRPDVRVAAQGLADSPWYQNGFQKDHPEAYIGALSAADDWRSLIVLDAPAFATPDADVPQDLLAATHERGLLAGWPQKPETQTPGTQASDTLWSLMSFRGDYDHDTQPDFFTSDLIADYGQALYKSGSALYLAGLKAQGLSQIERGWAMNWLSPQDAAFLGYDAFTRGDWAQARLEYGLSAALGAKLVDLGSQYAALPDVMGVLKSQEAQSLTHEGVAEQRLRQSAQAAKDYQDSLALYPSAEAHYDLAVLYWGKDWNASARELSLALQIDPHYAPALSYWPQIQARLKAQAPGR